MRKLMVCSLGFAALISGDAAADAFGDAISCHSLLEMGAYEEAVASCVSALDAATLSEEIIAVTANNLGRAHLKLGDMRQAEADFTRAITADENNAHAVNNRGIARAAQGELEAALLDFDLAIEIDATYLKAHFNRSKLRLESGDPYGALEDVTFVLAEQPDAEFALALRGDVLAKLGLPNTGVATADVAKQPAAQALPAETNAPSENVALVAPAPQQVEAQAPAALVDVAAATREIGEPQAAVEQRAVLAPPMPEYAAAPNAIEGVVDTAAPEIDGAASAARPLLAAIAPIDRPALDMAPLAAMTLADRPLAPVETHAGASVQAASPDDGPAIAAMAADDLATAIVTAKRKAPAGPAVDAPAPASVIAMESDHPTVGEYELAFERGRISVATVQKTLAKLGYRPGPADGLYGDRTRQALEACLAERCPLPR